MLSSSAGERQSPGWTPILSACCGAKRPRTAAAAIEEASRAGVLLAQVMTGPRASWRPSPGDHTHQWFSAIAIPLSASELDSRMVGWFANCMATEEMLQTGGSFLNADGVQSIIDGEIEAHPELHR